MGSLPPTDGELAAELLRRMAVDQEVRSIPARDWTDEDSARLLAVDADNTAAMRRIIAAHGWPGHALVGVEAARAAWLLVQHADQDPHFQHRALELLNAAVAAGDADAMEAAYLTDRCLVARGEPQQYGTQYFDDGDGQGYRPHPIADPARLDERRTAAGLEPFAEYDRRMRVVE